MSALPPSLPQAVPEIERRMRWRLLPTIVFIALLVLLLVISLVALFTRPEHPSGLPEHPAVAQARGLVAQGVRVNTGELRYRAALLGGDTNDRAPAADAPARLAEARRLLQRAERSGALRGDARMAASIGALWLAEHGYRRAEGEFRRAVEKSPHYGEGRLGLGVALALRADLTNELWQSRALRLQAAAQFAAVDARDEAYPHAMYDRALMLARVGRPREAARCAWAYFRMDSTSAWALALRREVFEAP